MKPWMKFLVWFGLGTALGAAIGEQVGYNKAKHEDEVIVNDAYKRGRADEAYKDLGHDVDLDKYQERICKIYGFPDSQEQYVDPPQLVTNEDEDAEMPMEEPVIPEPENEIAGARANGNPVDEYAGKEFHNGDIQQFHPTYTIPVIVDEEVYESRGDLDEKVLIYYEGDEVLYCVEDQKPIGEDEQPCLIGIGTLEAFRVGPGEPKDELFVVNETYGRFKILRMDDAFADAVDGTCAPDDDEFWDNGDC